MTVGQLRCSLGPTRSSWHPSVQFWEGHGPAVGQLTLLLSPQASSAPWEACG